MACNVKPPKIDYYSPDSHNFEDFPVEQTVLLREKYIHTIPFLKYEGEQECTPSTDEWYLYANSYYNHIEDSDALEKVSALLVQPEVVPPPVCLNGRSKFDPYLEQDAQQNYLESTPVSFIILGKPDIGQQELAKKLADFWKCVYIEPQMLIEEEIHSGSREGQCIEFNLRCGRAIGVDIIIKLVERAAKSQIAKHRGFVLCGLPVIPNDLYEDDPVSSQSAVFTAKDIFEDLLDAAIPQELTVQSATSKPQVSVSSKFKSEERIVDEFSSRTNLKSDISVLKFKSEERINKSEHQFKEPSSFTLPEVKSPSLPENLLNAPLLTASRSTISEEQDKTDIGLNYEKQLNILFGLLQDPFFIIYIQSGSMDVLNKRNGYRFDFIFKQTFDMQRHTYNKIYKNYINTEENIDDLLLEGLIEDYSKEIDEFRLKNLVKMPKDFKVNVSSQLDQYHQTALNFIEAKILSHNPQYFMKVDGRTSISRMLELIKAKLKILPLQKVIIPKKISKDVVFRQDSLDADGQHVQQESGENAVSTEKSPKTELRTLRIVNVVNKCFKWELSDWGTLCPVALKMGYKIEGSTDFVVQFMNKMFFLSSETFFTKFFKNPRPYLLSPNPRPSCKMYIFGPRLSGKSALAQCLAYYYNGTSLNTAKMIKEYLKEKQDEYLEKIKQNAIAEGIKLLNEMRKKEAKEAEVTRVENIKEWARHAVELLEKLETVIEERDAEAKKEVFEISAFPMAMKARAGVEENLDLVDTMAHIRTELEEMNIPIPSLQISSVQVFLKERRKLLSYLPPHLSKRQHAKPATVFDDFVVEYVQEAIHKAGLAKVALGGNSMLEMFLSNIKVAEEKYIAQGNRSGGWIIDGMILNVELLQNFYPYYSGDEVIILRDSSNNSFLCKRYEERQSTFFHDYKSFFKSIGENDAAWRCPSNEDLMINVEDIVSDLLDEMLEDDRFYETSEDSVDLPRVVDYKQDVSQFYKNWTAVQDFYEDHGIKPIEIDVANKEFPEIFQEVIKKIQKNYRVKATIAEEDNETFEEHTIPEPSEPETRTDDISSLTELDEDILSKNFGDTYHFCPVTFFENFVLWKGKEDIAAKFNGKTYLFSAESDFDKFLVEPRKYLPSKYIIEFPPPRICVVGVSTCGKTYISKALSNNYGLIYTSFESLVKKYFHVDNEDKLEQIKHPNIIKYLSSGETLPIEFYETLLKYWFSEPFKSRGFVFDDFPKRKVDIDFMVKHKMIPDVVLSLHADEEYTKTKLLERAVKIWQESVRKQQAEIEIKNERAVAVWKEMKLEKFNQMLEERRQERYSKKLEEVKLAFLKAKSQKTDSENSESTGDSEESEAENDTHSESEIYSQVTFDSVADQNDVDEIHKILDETLIFPTLIPLPSDDPTEVIIATTPVVNAMVDRDIVVQNDVKEKCEKEFIPYSQIILNLDDFEKSKISAFLNVDKLKFRNSSFFEICYDVPLDLVEKLLGCGYFFLSKFGRTCPVQYSVNENPVQMYLLNEEINNIYPVIHRSYIYFIGGFEQKEKFKSDPLKYIGVNFDFPLLQFRVAISGPPKCGKTVLSQRIHKEYGFKYISRGEAARYVLKYLSQSDLAFNMKAVLQKGWELTDEMIVGCVEAAYFDKWVVTQGAVFDGFPNTVQELRHLSYLNLVPNIVIDLQAETKVILQCLKLDQSPYKFTKYSESFILHMYQEWLRESSGFADWFDREYQVTRGIRIDPSNWNTWNDSKGYLVSTFWEVKHYHEHIKKDWPVRLGNMLVTPQEFVERRSGYKSYCPCCLHYSNILNNGGNPPDRTSMVQYREYFYWICSSHLEEFLRTPEMFLPPYNQHKMPESLPKRVRFNVMPDNVFEDGSCAVCYKEKRIIIKGNMDFSVEYNEKVYLFDTADCVNIFLREPQLYMFGIEFRAPVYPPLNYRDLPVMGMLEQYVAKYIIKGISHVSRRRPVIPGLTITASALIGLGLFIKIQNEQCPDGVKPYYEEGNRLFNKRRDQLLAQLDYMKRHRNPYIHYQEPLPEFRLPPSQKTLTGADIVAEILKEIMENVESWCQNPDEL